MTQGLSIGFRRQPELEVVVGARGGEERERDVKKEWPIVQKRLIYLALCENFRLGVVQKLNFGKKNLLQTTIYSKN